MKQTYMDQLARTARWRLPLTEYFVITGLGLVGTGVSLC